MPEPIRIVRHDELVEADPTYGMKRERAFEVPGLWTGRVTTAGGAVSGWHHHDSNESGLFVVQGVLRLECEGIEGYVDARAGDFVHVPAAAVPVPVLGLSARRAAAGIGRRPDRGRADDPAAASDLVNATVGVPDGRDDRRAGQAGLRLGLRHPIITPGGLILTNAHVAMPSAAGRGVFEWTRRRKSIPRTWSSLSSSRRTSRLCRIPRERRRGGRLP